MAEPVNLDDKCVLVTGGSMGIGLAAAEASLRAGARVGIFARTATAIDEAVDKLQADGLSDVRGIQGDVTQPGDVERALDELESQFGPVSGVIHAAGVYGPIGPITDVDPEEWLDAVRVNLFGSFVVVRQAARRLAAHGGG
ncbi:MAG: SDR family NAD(P)-dependent oxidoreductase, partial [Actinomycetota bacterium]|nr:SDR family NAD(P)-dependent oxidoreductase [Actinomycetota bacterium]